MWAFIAFILIATARPVALPSCPTGSFYDQTMKSCSPLVQDRDLSRGEAPAAPQLEPDRYCEKE